jgi:hypothetical protein
MYYLFFWIVLIVNRKKYEIHNDFTMKIMCKNLTKLVALCDIPSI